MALIEKALLAGRSEGMRDELAAQTLLRVARGGLLSVPVPRVTQRAENGCARRASDKEKPATRDAAGSGIGKRDPRTSQRYRPSAVRGPVPALYAAKSRRMRSSSVSFGL